jgi:ribosome-binding protein aMBF1 (putative translation factor)
MDRIDAIGRHVKVIPAMRHAAAFRTRGEYDEIQMPRARVPDEDAVRFGALVTRLRTERGWTLADLSRVSGMNATWLGVLERGGNMPSLATIFKLAEVFGVEASELVREIEQLRRVPRSTAEEEDAAG